jgi:hypothetical protein
MKIKKIEIQILNTKVNIIKGCILYNYRFRNRFGI